MLNVPAIKIAIDGPAAAGKSTVAKMVAKQLSYIYIDTGAMYRSITLKAINESVDLTDEDKLLQLLKETNIELKQSDDGQLVLLDGKDVTHTIRTKEVTNHVSLVAKYPKIRREMVKRQQEFATQKGIVMDGRDIGTHVLPDAEVKIFLVASVDERAKRRHKENQEKGIPSDLESIKEEIKQRDAIDTNRDVSPLTKAVDAIEIDTTSLTIEEVAERILQEAQSAIKRKGGL
ncbi:cytidylate kinase [Cerasibacillus quisquiliarum]|uniref:Cytidylate kinase n=1 Tax=Cerasibacillus quisquiliarum TaxID=227865 RepID=A0A511UYV6_9BACI|nr:cytidylate kinase [Cerasibacillus quisquiliarum]